MVFSIVLLSVFLVAMVCVGIWGLRKTSSLQDFFLGGRSVGPWMSAFAYGTTYFSAVIFIGYAGKQGWAFGWNGLWIALGNAFLGAFLAWVVLARRTRRMTVNLNAMTMPELLQERYGARFLKPLAAVIIFVFLLPYSASAFQGLGTLFEQAFHIPYDWSLLIMIGITGIYLILGGYFAVTLTDFIQALIMLVGCVFLVAVLTIRAGGAGAVFSNLSAAYAQHVPAANQPSLLTIASLVFMTSFGVWGLPQMVQKFYAIKNEKVIPRAALITLVFAGVIGVTAYYSGALTHLFYGGSPALQAAVGAKNYDSVMPIIFTEQLPSALMAVILLLILSASMSTLSSLVLVSSSAIAIDLYKGNADPKASDRNALAMMRFLSALFVAISYFIARFKFTFIVNLMSLSWGAVAGAFMAPYLYSLYWKRTTKAGVLAGMVTGLGVMLAGFLLFNASFKAQAPLWASAAMVAPFLVVPAVSLLTKPPAASRIERAFEGIGKKGA